MTQASVTANQVANEVVPTGAASGGGADSLSIAIGVNEPYGVPAIAITGNVFIDETKLPPRPATLPADLRNWDVLNTVIDYMGPPTLTSVSPTQGTEETTVTVTGTGFANASAVSFGDVGSAGMTVTSDTQLTAIAPPGSGIVDVQVTNPFGTSAINQPADQFTYMKPVFRMAARCPGRCRSPPRPDWSRRNPTPERRRQKA
jgi:hypothetical protein